MGPVATAALGIGTQMVSGLGNQIFGEMNQARELRGQRKALAQQNEEAMDIWEKTNYKAQMEQLKKAGLNPGLIYGMGGAGGTLGGSSATAQGAAGTGGMDIAGAAQIALLNAQRENIEADTANKKANTGKTNVDTDIAKANKIIAGLLAEEKQMDFIDYYGNQEETDAEGNVWVVGEKKNRIQRRETAKAELQAREGTAKNLVEQWKNGNLQKMSQAQLDDILKAIGVKEGTIKKLELENALTEMDKKLFEQLGMGKDSKGWVDTGINLILNLMRMGMRR